MIKRFKQLRPDNQLFIYFFLFMMVIMFILISQQSSKIHENSKKVDVIISQIEQLDKLENNSINYTDEELAKIKDDKFKLMLQAQSKILYLASSWKGGGMDKDSARRFKRINLEKLNKYFN